MRLQFDQDELRDLVREVVTEVVTAIDWPPGRLALDDAEAAQACGVARHVLRDLRLTGKIKGRKLGRKVVYTRDDLLAILTDLDADTQR